MNMISPCGEEKPVIALPIVQVSCVALLDSDSRILLASRPKGKDMAGLWEFPGGKIAEGERPEHALIRELDEELGVTTWTTCLAPLSFASHSYEKFHLVLFLFICRKWEGIVMPKEGQELVWVRKEHLRQYAMPEADVGLVTMLMDTL